MEVSVAGQKLAAIAAGVAFLLIVLLLAWIGGESHYRSCLAEVEARYPVSARTATALPEREAAISDCSRWP